MITRYLSCRYLSHQQDMPFFLPQDDDQEQVLTTLVSTILLRIANVWECDDDPTQAARSTTNEPAPEGPVPCLLNLILNSCWMKTPSLCRRQREIIMALMGRNTWRPSEDVLAALLGRLEHAHIQECCGILSLVSHVVRAFADTHGNSPRVTPFSGREKSQEPSESLSTIAALAFPLVLAKIEDESNSVRLSAMQTLAGILLLIQPDSIGGVPPCSEAGTPPPVASDR